MVQAQIDPAALVTHDERIVDRLGHHRQFDVVIRGNFAGQPVLGVIECKDLARKVNAPEIDAFVTKSRDVNANLRMLISRRGFSRQALEKCADYGIQPLSLFGPDAPEVRLFLGVRWEAESIRWGQISVRPKFVRDLDTPVAFKVEALLIGGKKVLDWFTNYLLANDDGGTELGWVVNVGVEFTTHQQIELEPGITHLCQGIDFHAERVCDRYEKVVSVSAIGFYDWNTKMATFPPGSKITTEPVTTDFRQWSPVAEGAKALPGFMNIRMLTRAIQFKRVTDAIDLEAI